MHKTLPSRNRRHRNQYLNWLEWFGLGLKVECLLAKHLVQSRFANLNCVKKNFQSLDIKYVSQILNAYRSFIRESELEQRKEDEKLRSMTEQEEIKNKDPKERAKESFNISIERIKKSS